MDNNKAFLKYILRLGDSALILGQRMAVYTGHGPILEQDMAITNIALDHIGQSRLLYQYAADLEANGKTEDDYAFLRTEREFMNYLICEYPNHDFAYIIARQFFYDVFAKLNYSWLKQGADRHLASIASKSLKEVDYHLEYSRDWMLRLGDGTDESHNRIQNAINDIHPYSGEMYTNDDIDNQLHPMNLVPNLDSFKSSYMSKIEHVLNEAGLKLPENTWMQLGGKQGRHTEEMGVLLAEMQYMQRAYPNMKW